MNGWRANMTAQTPTLSIIWTNWHTTRQRVAWKLFLHHTNPSKQQTFHYHIQSASRLPCCEQISITKFMHGLWNTNAQNKRFYNTTDACPICSTQVESLCHIFTCQSPQSITSWQEALLEFHLQLEKIKTPPPIIVSITSGRNQWATTESILPSINTSPTNGSLRDSDILLSWAFSEQTSSLGWLAFLQGKHSIYWKAAYNSLLPPSPHHAITTETWASCLIWACWTYAWSIWWHQNGAIHGRTLMEGRDKLKQKLST